MFLATLSDDKQARILVRFSLELTIHARTSYTVGGDGLDHPERMRRINETIHRALGQSDKCLRGDRARYSVEALAGILLVHDDDFMRSASEAAFDRARTMEAQSSGAAAPQSGQSSPAV
jgi:hypothetical protein